MKAYIYEINILNLNINKSIIYTYVKNATIHRSHLIYEHEFHFQV